MAAVVAALLFLLSLIEQLTKSDWGVLTPSVLSTAGFLFLAVHLIDWGRFRRV